MAAKDKGVCEDCIYWKKFRDAPMLGSFCNFLEMEGKSRILVEQENGGIKYDSCICKVTGEKAKNKAGWKWRNF
jgi:hypothetical protein